MSSNKSNNNKLYARTDKTELIDVLNYDLDNMIFDEPVSGTIPGSTIPFFRINVASRNSNKSEGHFVFDLPKLSTYGIKESLDPQTKALTGYSAGLLLFDREGQTEEQKKYTDAIISIIEKCKDHLFDPEILKKVNKKNIKVKEQLDSMSTLSFVKDKNTGDHQLDKPVLNVKLMYAKGRKDKEGNDVPSKIMSKFYSEDEVEIDPLDYLDKKGLIRAAIKLESIFVGKDIKIQMKIYQAALTIEEKTGFRSLLRFNRSNETRIEFNMDDDSSSNQQQEEESFSVPIKTIEVNDEPLEASDDESISIKKKKPTKKNK
jgi:hypothetical protein